MSQLSILELLLDASGDCRHHVLHLLGEGFLDVFLFFVQLAGELVSKLSHLQPIILFLKLERFYLLADKVGFADCGGLHRHFLDAVVEDDAAGVPLALLSPVDDGDDQAQLVGVVLAQALPEAVNL
jgi:hypothetical protein